MNINKIHFNTGISPKNKLRNYMSFTSKDKILSDFIDYLSFYTTWDHSLLLKLLSSDNGPALYLGRLSIDCIENKVGLFRAWVSVSHMGIVIKLCQLREMKIWEKIVLKIDIYWKWLKLLREDSDLYKTFYIFCRDRLMLWEDINITRIDYTVDCAKLNFRKKNSLRCRVSWLFTKDGDPKTKYFGKRWHDSALFIRYYDKKEEISVRGTEILYPEYRFLPCVMRYELQVNSKWLSKEDKEIKLSQLHDLICLWYEIPDRLKKLKKEEKDETDLESCIKSIKSLINKKDLDSIQKLLIYINDLKCKWVLGFDWVVSCEILDRERLSQNN